VLLIQLRVSHTFLPQTSSHLACPAPGDTTRGRVPASKLGLGMAISHSSRDQPSCSDQSPEERQGPAVQTISPAILAIRTAQPHWFGFAHSNHRAERRTKQPQRNHRAHFFFGAISFVFASLELMHCHFRAENISFFRFPTWIGFCSTLNSAARTLPAQSAAPQMRLRDAYPVTPPSPLFPRRQCLRCAPASAPVFRAREKPAETIHSARLADAPESADK
jgi:hypothetical protein